MPGRGGLGTSVATAMLGYAMMGWAMGSMNSSALVMRAALGLGETEAYSDTVWGLLISIYGVGAMIGCSMSAQLADQLGRVAFVAITGILFVVAAALMTTAVLGGSAGIALMLVGRFLAGAASGGITVVMPAYLSEIAPIELRGALSISMQLVSVVSLLGVQLAGLPIALGTREAWPLVMALSGAPGLLQLLLLPLMVESPRWLAHAGHFHEAAAARAQLEGTSRRPRHYAQLEDGPEPEVVKREFHTEHGAPPAPTTSKPNTDVPAPPPPPPLPPPLPPSSLRELLADDRLRGLLTVVVTAGVVQQLSGISAVVNLSTVWLQENGVPQEWIALTIIWMNAANVVATIVAGALVERSGRRQLLLGSVAGMIGCILCLTAGMCTLHTALGVRMAVWGVVGFVAAFGLGMGPIPWLLPSELFEQRHRATAAGVAALCNWGVSFFVTTVFLPMANVLGPLSFVPFLCALVCYLAYAWHALPETRGHHPDGDSEAAARAGSKFSEGSAAAGVQGGALAGSSPAPHWHGRRGALPLA